MTEDIKHEGYSLEVENHLGIFVEMGRCLSEKRLKQLIELFTNNLKREHKVRKHTSHLIQWPEEQ